MSERTTRSPGGGRRENPATPTRSPSPPAGTHEERLRALGGVLDGDWLRTVWLLKELEDVEKAPDDARRRATEAALRLRASMAQMQVAIMATRRADTQARRMLFATWALVGSSAVLTAATIVLAFRGR